MKKLLLSTFLIFSTLLFAIAQTSDFTIKGTVWNTSKKPVADWQLTIYSADPAIPEATVKTDKDGNYVYTVSLGRNVTEFKVTTTDPCSRDLKVGHVKGVAGTSQTLDFIICDPNGTGGGSGNCPVKFSYKINSMDYTGSFSAVPDYPGAKYIWDFGDGTSAEGQTIEHKYAKAGTYNVTVTVVTTDCKSSNTQAVVINRPTTTNPTYNINASCCGKMNIQSVAVSTSNSPYTYKFTASGDFKAQDASWNFGDGTSGTGLTVTHSYAAVGTYKVSVKIVGEECTVIINSNIVVADRKNPNPCPFDFTYGTANLDIKLLAQFKQKPDSFKWDLGDGTTNSTDEALKHSYTKAGTYTITLEAVFAGVPCKITKTIKVGSRVTTNPASITITDASPIPAGDEVTLTIKSDGNYKVTLVFADMTGISLKKYELELNPGENKFPTDIKDLKAGVYVVYIYYDNNIVSKYLITKQ